MSIPRSSTACRAAIALVTALSLIACTTANPAPPAWQKTLKQAQKTPDGAWINVTARDQEVSGELLAVGKVHVYVLTDGQLRKVKRSSIRSASLSWYTADNSSDVAGVGLGAVSTLSHGVWLILSFPVLWLLIGTSAARSHSAAGFEEASGGHAVGRWKRYARFPAGLPKGFGRKAPAPPGPSAPATPGVGSAGQACYPNNTCDAGLVCDARLFRCVAKPELGHQGGACYANKTCEEGLSCLDDICSVDTPPPASDTEPASDAEPGDTPPAIDAQP